MRPALALALVLLVLMGGYHLFVIWHQHRMETLGVRPAGILSCLPALAVGFLVRLTGLGRAPAVALAGLLVLLPTITGLMFTRFEWAADQTWAWAAGIAAAMMGACIGKEL